MNKYFYILVFSFCLLVNKHGLFAQSSYIDLNAAQVFSTFKFSSQSTTNIAPPYSQINSTAYGIGYTHLTNSGIMILGGFDFRKAGASMVYQKTDYLWSLQYIDFKAGVGYQYDKWRIKPYVALTPFYAYMLNARQSVGLYYYDIKTTKSIKPYDLGIFASGGMKVALSPYILLYAQYDYNLGLKNIETTTGQSLYNRGFDVKLGLIFSITKFKNMQNYIEQTEQGIPQYPIAEDPSSQQNSTVNNQTKTENNTTNANPSNVIANNQIKTEDNNNNKTLSQPQSEKITTPGTIGWNNPNQNSAQGKNTIDQNTEDSQEKSGIKTNNNTTSKTKDKIEFKIQITSVKNSLDKNSKLLKKAGGEIQTEKGKDGWIRYYIGSYTSYEEARGDLGDVKAMGFSNGCFVVAFKNGKKITVAEAKALLK